MKTLGLRSLYKEAPALTENVLVVHSGQVIGEFRPIQVTVLDFEGIKITEPADSAIDLATYVPPRALTKEASMDDIGKKAIEPDQVRVKRGIPTKGLGDLPGTGKDVEQFKPDVDPYKAFKPAPKPGKK